MSIHLCGTISRNTLASSIIPDIAITFDRVQINSVEKYYNAESLSTLCNQSSLIVQHRGTSNFDSPYSDFCDLLYDPSAGRGEHPDEWPIVNPPSGKLVGYAGGISADNVKELVSNDIMDNQNYWIDMESSIRVDNYLDIGKCRKICEIVFGDPVS
jgi:phosphoribosylanthranilate isomerase